MTTLTIEIPQKFEKALTKLIEHTGGRVVATNPEIGGIAIGEDEKLTPGEMELFNRALEEILLIKEGRIESIPFSELWKD